MRSDQELGDVSKSELVHSCSSVSAWKDGHERINVTAFHGSPHDAEGISLGDDGGKEPIHLVPVGDTDREEGSVFRCVADVWQLSHAGAPIAGGG